MSYAAILYITTVCHIYTKPLHPVALFLSNIKKWAIDHGQNKDMLFNFFEKYGFISLMMENVKICFATLQCK